MQNKNTQVDFENEDAYLVSGAIILENLQSRWLVELSDRLYPFDCKASFKLEACSKRIQRNMEQLTLLYTEQFGLPLRPSDMSGYTNSFRNRFAGEKHFLIINREMAHRCLSKIHEATCEVVEFFKWATRGMQDKSLLAYFQEMIALREVLVMILGHYVSEYHPEGRPPYGVEEASFWRPIEPLDISYSLD